MSTDFSAPTSQETLKISEASEQEKRLGRKRTSVATTSTVKKFK